MNSALRNFILQATGASELGSVQHVQSLWSGYGSIDRYRLIGAERHSVVVKHVRLAAAGNHPRGWNTDLSHQRKLQSYLVETNWYEHWAARCDADCRVPHCLALDHQPDQVWMVLEDLNDSGFPLRHAEVSRADMLLCIRWLASFHATFIGESPDGLWPVGTYWHLATRPDELAAMQAGELQQAAGRIDQLLSESPWQTLVHGDAKLANFCFSADGRRVAAVDFQYVGGGCGMKDLAYFIGSCLDDAECERHTESLLDAYFIALGEALALHHPELDAQQVEAAWRPLYPVACTDFLRFLKGWSPAHWKVNSYSERLAQQVIAQLS